MVQYFARPTQQACQSLWLRVLDLDRLPVLSPNTRRGADGGPVYDLDTAALDHRALIRLAAYIARQQSREYGRVLDEMREAGVSIPALGCELLLENEVVETV